MNPAAAIAILLWVLISVPSAIAIGTVIRLGQSDLARFHPARRPKGQRASPMPHPHAFNNE
jgi:hypothetical protein